jgi:hypothetical protein
VTDTAAPPRPRLEDFRLDPVTGVHVPPQAGTPAGYLDGA